MDSLRTRIAEFVGLPSITERPVATAIESHSEEGYTRTLLPYSAPDGDFFDAFLFDPSASARRGAVLAVHQRNSQWAIGKSEIAGLVGDPL